MNSFASVVKAVASNFYGWCGANNAYFVGLSRWLDEKLDGSIVEIRCSLLTKQLINNLMAISLEGKERFLTQIYVNACITIAEIMYESGLSLEISPELTQAMQDVLTVLSGRILLYTPLDCLLIMREMDSAITEEDEQQATDLLLFLSAHPSYYRVQADKLAAAAIFYCSYEDNPAIRDGIVLGKGKYLYTLSQTVDTIQGMIEELVQVAGWIPSLYAKAPLDKPSVTRHYLYDDDVVGTASKPSLKDNLIIITDDSLGSGSYGQVFRAKANTAYIAVKIQDDPEVAIRELILMCSLTHANVQSARSFSFQGNLTLIHMPIQQSLHDLIYSSHTFEEAYALHDQVWIDGLASPFRVLDMVSRRSYARQLLQGLVYLADMRIVHGDIKPSNLLVTSSGVLKIADYGMAIVYSPSLDFAKDSEVVLYGSYYRDPNIRKPSKRFSFEADVYASGISLLEMEVSIVPYFQTIGINFGCIRDRHFRTVCTQMLARDIYSRVSAEQALAAF
ncbi:Cyclin-dependent kinase 1 [uncultured virus]|nr:Cyclin-dependent kinase 1 [uncultured virus]